MQSLAEWKFGSGNVGDKKKKQKVNYEPHRPTAGRLKKQKVDYELHRPTAARLIRRISVFENGKIEDL